MRNFDRGGAAINVIAAANHVDVEVIDVGVDADLKALTHIRHQKVRPGSRNMFIEPAMTTDELAVAFAVGIAAAQRAVADGVLALGLGEMGIGNTTAAAALLSALTGQSAESTVGRGTGVDDATLTKKCAVVEAVLNRHVSKVSSRTDPRELMRCVGGLELAAIAGAALEAARHGIAVMADGFISTVAILCALRMETTQGSEAGRRHTPLSGALFFAHRSAERGHGLALEACAAVTGYDTRPLLTLDMRLGEGSGAALAMPIIRAAAAIMRDMATFASAGVSAGAQADVHTAPQTEPG
jgi:nicotinate-nucleotide--dimethylbenzimidazole phosphoribosyltransferase